jgi:chitin disaccharide deacetylase
MRGLIVNGDDFGLSPGINRGIAQAHCDGILTSTSLLVDTPFSRHAAAISAQMPQLTVGLHADLTATCAETDDERAAAVCVSELDRQIARFHTLTGRGPTHLDSHHNAHRRPELVDSFLRFGEQHELRVREHCCARYVSAFYGRWGGRAHLEQVSVAGLERVLRANDDDLIELACHPGYCDETLRSSYRREREAELRTLCDRRVRQLLSELGFGLLDSRLRHRVS